MVMVLLTPIIVFLSFVGVSHGLIYERYTDLPAQQFDFVVVGGGTAGNVVANRLTENPNFSVLVLEAGGSHDGILNTQIPAFALSLGGSPLDWNYTAKIGPGNRTLLYNRGFVLGGSSTINWMAYTRGSADDWDRYAAISGDPGWSWNSMQEYIRKNERIVPPADKHDTTGQWNPAFHGKSGINSVSLSGFTHELDKRTMQLSKSLGEDSPFKFNLDMNSGDTLGFGWAQSTVLNGTRSSSATSYLGPQYITRPNLHVLLHSRVTRILPSNQQTDGALVFQGVEFTQDDGATVEVVTALNEIVLSAGSIGTPHILLNSGIGDTTALNAVGVQSLVHLPSVGKNLTEHPAATLSWVVNSTDTNESIFTNPAFVEQWQNSRTGPLVDPVILNFGLLRVPQDAPIFQTERDPSAGPKSAHYELATINGLFGIPTSSENYISVGVLVVSPASRGSVTLASPNPLVYPSIDLNIMGSPFDLYAMREGLRNCNKFMSSKIWTGFTLRPTPELNFDSDVDLNSFILNTAAAAAHSVGTSSMSPKGAIWGVVDPDLRVKGIKRVRIVDSSVMPFVPAAHTQAPTYMVGERGADLIKKDWT